MSSGFLTLPAESPAKLLPLLICQHLSDSLSLPLGWGQRRQSLNLRGTDAPWITRAAWPGSGRRAGTGASGECLRLGCRRLCVLRVLPASSLPALLPGAWQAPSRNRHPSPPPGHPGEQGGHEPRGQEARVPCPSCHQAPGALAQSLSLSDMSYLVREYLPTS